MDKVKINFEELEISGKRYKELCGFCEQYPEWKEKLNGITYIRAVQYSDDPQPSNRDNSDTTQKHALRALALKRKVEMVEKCAHKVDEAFTKKGEKPIWEYIIRSACYEESWEYLYTMGKLNLGRTVFYNRRRYFFYQLDIEKRRKDKEFINS